MSSSGFSSTWFGKLGFLGGRDGGVSKKAVGNARVVARNPVRPPSNSGPSKQELPKLETIGSIAELPQITQIYTAAKSAYELPDSVRSGLIAVANETGEAWVLVDPAAFRQQSVQLDSLRARLRNGNVPIRKTAFADKALISSLYQMDVRTSGDEDGKSSEEARLFEEFVRYGLDIGATDLHFIVNGQNGAVRYRVDTEMEPMKGSTGGTYTREQVRGAVAYAYNKLMAQRTNSHSTFTPDESASCMIPYRLGQKDINLRWQSARGFSQTGGAFSVFIRYIHNEGMLKVDRYQDLGYSDDQAEMMMRASVNRKGLFLICGITNSGKSTTLTYYVESLPDGEKLNIITVEDPAEREIKNASLQISLQRNLADGDKKTSFTEVQAILVRSDPDVIFQGEIRDVASGVCAQTLLQTGHQVLGTLHTDGIMGVPSRMTSSEIGFSMHTITQRKFWSVIVYQALVPKLCECAEKAEETIPHVTDFIRDRFRIDTSGMRSRRIGGCPKCKGRGIKGVTVVAEMYRPTRLFLNYIREGKDYEAEREWRGTSDGRFDSPDMTGKTVFEHALYKAYLGILDPRTVETFELLDQYEIIKEAA